MRISDWSSDVCSSDLNVRILAAAVRHQLVIARHQRAQSVIELQATVGRRRLHAAGLIHPPRFEIAAEFARIVVARRTFVIDPVLMRGLRIDREQRRVRAQDVLLTAAVPRLAITDQHQDRNRVEWGKSRSVRVELGGGLITKKKKKTK